MKAKLQICAYYFKNFKGQSPNSFTGINLNKNYYKTLQVDNCACEVTIRKAYLRLAKKMHPDVNPSGHDGFTQIQEAYNVLCDKETKMYYDQNNTFYPRYKQDSSQKRSKEDEDLNYRNSQFYQQMKNKGYQDFKYYEEKRKNDRKYQKQRQKETEQQREQAKQKKRAEQEIKIAKFILFSRNPLWHRRNCYMNYQQRTRKTQEKQKKFQDLFPKGSKIGKFLSKFI